MADAKQIIRESIKRLDDRQNQARLVDTIEKLAYYDYDYDFIIEVLKKFIKRKDKDIPYSPTNITSKIINSKSVVYKKQAFRAVEESKQDIYNDLTADKHSSIKIAERQTTLIGRIGYGIMWDKELKRFAYDILQYFIPLKVENGKITSLMFPIDAEVKDKKLWVYWGPDFHVIINEHGVAADNQEDFGITNKDFENKYKTIPFVFPFVKEPIGGIWVEGATDVVKANEQINILMTTLNFLDRYASFKQPWIKGQNLKEQKVKFGYNQLVSLETMGDDGSDLGVLDIQADLNQKIDNVKFQIELILKNNDLSARFGGEGSATSGFQLIVENIDLLMLWEDMIPIWRKHEADIYEIEKKVFEVENSGKKLPEDMVVNFADVRFPVDKKDQREQDTWNLEHGLTSRLEIAKRENPDKDVKELEEDLEKFEEAKPKPPRQGFNERKFGL